MTPQEQQAEIRAIMTEVWQVSARLRNDRPRDWQLRAMAARLLVVADRWETVKQEGVE